MELDWNEAVWAALEEEAFRPDEEGVSWDTNTYDGKQTIPPEVVAALNDLRAQVQAVADTQ